MVRKQIGATATVAALCGALTIASTNLPPAHAGILSRLRRSIGSLWSQRHEKRESAQQARSHAGSIAGQAEAVHDRLESAQQLLQIATGNYYNYFHQMQRTQGRIAATQQRIKVVTARYNQHKEMFGRRLGAMQANGKLGYLHLLLSSRTLSDLSRRAYLYNEMIQRDSELQNSLRQDKAELETARRFLAQEWSERNALQLQANSERERIANAFTQQERLLYTLNHSREAQLAYAAAQEQSAEEIGGMIRDLSARRSAIIDAYEQSSRERYHYRTHRVYHYRRHRVARRVQRIRYVPTVGGILKPMPIQEVIYHDEMVPVDDPGSLSQGFSTEGERHGDAGWEMPVRGRLSSRYGMRYHPILHRRKLHTGDDIAAGMGTPIRAAAGGRVLWTGWKKAYGNTIIVDNGNGVTTLYGHTSKIGVRAGQPLKGGDYIGNVGSTGWSTGPHLHFEVRKNGLPIDPTPYLQHRR
jgi:murein DD-endopeptidase MepM/ murein hydrolase activator NlpD